ncbi:hypothetical protein M3Y99_00477900 [Aphelenchoides fujianensis]|nr:hypothetical protein M3Y99_00477900 [Aphelenchoides fujianensis]
MSTTANRISSPLLALVLSFLLVRTAESTWSNKKYPFNNDKMLPRDAFPPPTFDPQAPFCTAGREPCGFYSFSLNGNLPFKWVKSWCQCSPDHECVFDRTDMRMRVFRQACAPRAEQQAAAVPLVSIETSEREHRHHSNRSKHRRHRAHKSHEHQRKAADERRADNDANFV